MVTISIIAAIDDKRGIGKGNRLLWHIPEDLQRFKSITDGHPVIIGRKTYQSIGRPLPGRTNIIVSRDTSYHAEGCLVTRSLEEAMAIARSKDSREIFIIGGGQLYAQGIMHAKKLYLTLVKGDFGADTFFPEYNDFKPIKTGLEKNNGRYTYRFIVLEKR